MWHRHSCLMWNRHSCLCRDQRRFAHNGHTEMSAPHVLFVNRFFHPDHSATSQMLSDLSFHLAERGWRVEVVTSRQRYDDARARLPPRETVRGVAVRRVWSTRFGRGFLPGRAVDYATFYASAFFALVGRATRDSTIIALT